MTVKRNGDRVILKDGKVSCSCCDTECCMYPAQALADGLYSADDLPDAVDFTYSALGNTFGPYTLTRTGTVFRGGPDDEIVIELIGELWGSADGGGGLESFPCLINEALQPSGASGYEITVEDQFADTYTFASAGMTPPSVVVARRSLCRWDFFEEDPEGGGRYWILEYANDRGPDALWYFTIPSTFPGYKTGLQNSPVGTYTGSGLWTGTIS